MPEKKNEASDGSCRREGRTLRQAPPPNSSTLTSSSLGRHPKARSIPLPPPPSTVFLGGRRLQLLAQARSSVSLDKSAWDRCRQRRRRHVVSESRCSLARSSEGHRTSRPGPMRSARTPQFCSWGEPQRLDFGAAEVYAPVSELQL